MHNNGWMKHRSKITNLIIPTATSSTKPLQIASLEALPHLRRWHNWLWIMSMNCRNVCTGIINDNICLQRYCPWTKSSSTKGTYLGGEGREKGQLKLTSELIIVQATFRKEVKIAGKHKQGQGRRILNQ